MPKPKWYSPQLSRQVVALLYRKAKDAREGRQRSISRLGDHLFSCRGHRPTFSGKKLDQPSYPRLRS